MHTHNSQDLISYWSWCAYIPQKALKSPCNTRQEAWAVQIAEIMELLSFTVPFSDSSSSLFPVFNILCLFSSCPLLELLTSSVQPSRLCNTSVTLSSLTLPGPSQLLATTLRSSQKCEPRLCQS